MGNICRSPAAEGVFREYVSRSGYQDMFHIASAGTLHYHAGSLPDERMRRAAAQRGYRLESHARQVKAADLSEFDLVLAMDNTNLDHLHELVGKAHAHVQLFGSFLEQSGGGAPSIPDPYHGSMDGFELVLDMIESACPSLLQYCLAIRNKSR